MGVVKGVVLPVLRLLVWGVIAVALCVLAFRDDRPVEATGPLEPGMGVEDSIVPAALADVASRIELTGTVADDTSLPVRSTAAGTVTKILVEPGDAVDAETPVVQVRVQLDPVPGTTVTAPDGSTTTAPDRPRTRTVTVVAGAVGTLDALAVLLDQEVAVGEDVATVDPGTLTVQAPLTQSQQFRLLTPPAVASAQAPGGPAPFQCEGLRAGAPQDDDAATEQPVLDPYSGVPAEQTTAQVTCRVPTGTTVFAGMSVNLTIDVGAVTGAVTVPVTAVLGSVGEGRVWVADPAGGPAVEQAVTLGITDGAVVQVVEGLAEGDEVMEFPPVPSDDEGAGQP